MNRKRVVFVVQDALMKKLLSRGTTPTFDRAFFESAAWTKAPNSTSRLNLVNYQAWQRLEEFDVHVMFPDEVSPELVQQLQHADVVVVNQVASKRSLNFVTELAKWLSENPIRAKVVFGTEATWFKELDKGNVTQQAVERAYFGDLLLRHTAKTDTVLYGDERAHSAVIQEFELGIDTNVVAFGRPANERRLISFARAPEGRTTKNNSAIDIIKRLIRESPELSKYELNELVPPYGSTEYWDAMGESAFFVFTSDGETFSYCLNDAKAAGAVAFYPEHMYYNSVGHAFAVESYPWLGLKYSSHENLLSQMETIARDPDALLKASLAARECVVESFSLDKVADNWRRLLGGDNLNDQALYLYDASRRQDRRDVIHRCRDIGAKFAMPYRNMGGFPGSERSLTAYDPVSGVTFVRYYLSGRANGGSCYRVIAKINGRMLPGIGRGVDSENSTETARFLQLLCRVYKVGTLYLDESLESMSGLGSLANVTTFAGLRAGLVPMPIALVKE